MSKATGTTTTAVGSIRRNRQMALIGRIILALAMLTFALFPVIWVFSASLHPSGNLTNQSLAASTPKRAANLLQPVWGWAVTSMMAAPSASCVPGGRFSLLRSRSMIN